jgi:hypothetical protein
VNKKIIRVLSGLGTFLVVCARVQAQPAILQQPISILDQLLGSTVSFCVGAQSPSSTNLQYQWLRNGVIIPGATNSCLPINDLQAINCGAFSVLVSDGVGVAVSEPADLTVTGLDILQGLDNIIDALDLIQTNGVIRSYNTNAVKQPGTPEIIPGDPGGAEIWFKWTVPTLQSSGIVTFNTLGSDFDTTMAAYTGSEPTSLTPVPSAISDDDAAGYLNSQVSFYAVKGTTYLIAVDGFFGARGNVVLSWTLYPGSSKLPNAAPMPQAVVSNNGALVSINSPWQGKNCDWFLNGELFATNTSVLYVGNLSQSTVGSYVARFTTPDGIVVSSEPTELQINLLQDGSTSTNSIAWVKFLDSANNPFIEPGAGKDDAIKLGGGGDSAGYSCCQVFSTSGNPGEPGEPVVCNQDGAHPSWYSYVAPASGTLLINSEGSTFNTILGVFTGPGNCFSTLTNIGCGYTTDYQHEGQPSVYVPNIPAGQTNYIVIEGENGASGQVHLNLYFGSPISITSPLINQSGPPGTNVELSVAVTGSSPITYTWQFNGTNIPGATNYALTISNLQDFNAGTYDVLVSNSVSESSSYAVVSCVAAPAIITQPVSQTVAFDGTATLNVTATGSPAPVYQWFRNGTAGCGNGNALSIPSFQSIDEGRYTVVVSNNLGSVTSSPALLLLNGPLRVQSFALSSGNFSLELAGVAGGEYIIMASSDLIEWVPVFTNYAPNGILSFSDTNAAALNYRFYRAVTNSQ